MSEIEQVRRVKEKYSLKLLAKSLVIGVGVGPKIKEDENTGENCIRVYVTHKLAETKVDDENKIPGEIEGVKTDVLEQEALNKTMAKEVSSTAQERTRPARPGCSISHYATNARGTMGSLVADKKTDELLFLSNWHVAANNGMCRQGDPILQPGGLDGGGLPDDIIGYLERWNDVRMLCPMEGERHAIDGAKKRIRKAVQHDIDLPVNYVDVAAAKPVSDDAVDGTPLGWGEGTEDAGRNADEHEKAERHELERGKMVAKSGASTGVTSGTVVDNHYDTLVTYSNAGVALFKDQVLTNSFGVLNPAEKVSSSLQVDYLKISGE